MSLAQTKVHLEKIIALYKSMAVNEKNITAIERDLMLQYVRNLYETVLTLDVNTSFATPSVPPKAEVSSEARVVKPEVPKVEVSSEARVVKPEVPKAEVSSEARVVKSEVPKVEVSSEARVVKPEVPKVEVSSEARVVKPEVPKAEVSSEARVVKPEVPKVEVSSEARVVKPEVPKVEIPKPTPPSPTVHVSPEIKALFEDKVTMELSERLSQTPIADITRAFSINDRLLNIKELFANQGEVYHNTLGTINEMQSFAQAENILLQVATQNNWAANEDRQKQARNFIKVVRRRFK